MCDSINQRLSLKMEIILFIITNICLCKMLWFCGRLHNGWKFQEPWPNSLGRHLKFPHFTSKGTWCNCFNFLQGNEILNEAYLPTSFSSAFLISSFVQLSQLAPFSSIVKLLMNFTSQHLKKIIAEKITKERLPLELKMTPSTQKIGC